MAENWLARPLSVGRNRIVLSSLRACFLSSVTLVLGGCAFWRRLLTVLLTGLACSVSSGLIADSTLATISVDGILVGINAKFNLSTVAKPQCRLRTLRCIGRRNRGLFRLQKLIKFTSLSVFGLIKDSLGVATDLFKYIIGRKSGCYIYAFSRPYTLNKS